MDLTPQETEPIEYDIRAASVMLPAPWNHAIDAGIVMLAGKPWVVVKQVCAAALYPHHTMSTKAERLIERLGHMQATIIRLDSNNKPELLHQLRFKGLVGSTSCRANIVALDELGAALYKMGKPKAAVASLLNSYTSLVVPTAPSTTEFQAGMPVQIGGRQPLAAAVSHVPEQAMAGAGGMGVHEQNVNQAWDAALLAIAAAVASNTAHSNNGVSGAALQRTVPDGVPAKHASVARAAPPPPPPAGVTPTTASTAPEHVPRHGPTATPTVNVHVTTDIGAMPFPVAWPRTLPAARYRGDELTGPYNLTSMLPNWREDCTVPLANEVPKLREWFQAAVNVARRFIAARDVTFDNMEATLLQYMGFCFRHRNVPSSLISGLLLTHPGHLASFLSFLLARGLTDTSLVSTSAHITKLLSWWESTAADTVRHQ